jgi:peptidase E
MLDISMVILYFLGGEDVVKRDSREINEKAFIDAAGAPVVLIFPWTAESVDKADKYRKIMADYFKELGASKIEFAELSDSLKEIIKKMDRSDLVYLPGGVTKLLVQRIKDAKIDRLLQKYKKVIIGNSAGALALCKDCILTRDKENLETTIISGFGLVDFSVEVHYNPSKDKELKKLSEERRIYAIPEKSALVYDNGNLSFIGPVYLFYKGKKKKY